MSYDLLILGESLELLIDNRGKNPKYTDKGVPTVSGMAIRGGRIDMSNVRRVSMETWRQWMPSQTRRHDVILTSEAPLGRVALVESDEPLALAQRVFGLRGRAGVLDTRFLYYALQTDFVQAELRGRATGTTVFGIRQPSLKQVRIPAPAYEIQEAIAEVLGALDEKISANAKLAKFVDEYLSTLLRDAIVDLNDWTTLDSIATVNQVAIKPASEGNLRYIDIASVGIGEFDYPNLSPWSEAPGRARRKVKRGDTLWSTVRPNRRSHALNLSDDPTLVASTGLAVLTPTAAGFAYLYEVTRLPEFTAYLENVAEGSAYPAVRADRFKNAPIPAIDDDKRLQFEFIATPMREHVHSLSEESRTLAATRDALLPQLMSGKLRVKDAEQLVSEVV